MKIIIIGYFKYPFGSAGASRVRNIAMGLRQSGNDVRVITQAPIEERLNDLKSDNEYYYDGIRYTSSMPTSIKTSSFSTKVKVLLQSINCSVSLLEKFILKKDVDLVIVYALTYMSAKPIVSLCKKMEIPVLVDNDEWVTSNSIMGGVVNPQFWQIVAKRKFVDPQCDGVIAISRFISEKYNRLNLPVLRVPALFNFQTTIFPRDYIDDKNLFSLTFVGGIKVSDGLLNLLKAVRLVRKEGINLELRIIGVTEHGDLRPNITELIEKNKSLKNGVKFYGRVSYWEYFHLLENSSALILPRDLNTMTRAAFPNRLPEYLASGRPVITTAVPDIPEYLHDKVHAHVVKSNSPELIAERIISIWNNKTLGNQMGESGRERAKECFDYILHGKRIASFLNSLV